MTLTAKGEPMTRILYVEDEAWEMSQTLPDSITKEGWGSPGIYRLYQYGINFGGPMIKDKLWFFGSYGIQDIHARTITQTEDSTWLRGYYGKVDFQFGNTSGMLQYAYDGKMKWGRPDWGSSNHSVETLWDQDGPGGGVELVQGGNQTCGQRAVQGQKGRGADRDTHFFKLIEKGQKHG